MRADRGRTFPRRKGRRAGEAGQRGAGVCVARRPTLPRAAATREGTGCLAAAHARHASPRRWGTLFLPPHSPSIRLHLTPSPLTPHLFHSDAFADAEAAEAAAAATAAPTSAAAAKGPTFVHIRVQQRNGRKSLTTIQGLDKGFDYKKVIKAFKKEFCCNGTVVEDAEAGAVIQLQGDQRKNASTFLVDNNLVKKSALKIHGF